MFQMMGVFAEFERAMIRERVMAGLARARQAGIHLGRKFTEDTQDGTRKVKAALALRAKGFGYRKIAREVGLGVGTVIRLTASQEVARPFESANAIVRPA
jgi:DNA invertase Pin-like site-specific DNA recombinase